MKRETIIWLTLFVLGGAFLLFRAFTGGMGKGYVEVVEKSFVRVADVPEQYETGNPTGRMTEQWVPADAPEAVNRMAGVEPITWTDYEGVPPRVYEAAQRANPSQTQYEFSLRRTLGIWVAAFFTLAIFSFLYRDNPFYKFAESVVIGVSAAYWMVVGFWTTIVPNLFGKLFPSAVKSWSTPDLPLEEGYERYLYLVPLILGIMLLWRLSPKGAWIARWPLAFIIGTTAGLRLFAHMQADFVGQINNSIIPLAVTYHDDFDFWKSLSNVTIAIGVLACLVYFFFSIEHKGVVGKTARLGIWFLMITFGASFGYTVMGRIALLAIRLEFLFDDWLWLIDPTGKRVVEAAAMIVWRLC